ncbi:prominin-like protein [Drosophila miranda]|uniref:prominin-like protein n=1 Tax=Drosophila miranda TaxID=7229 RepID=UPI0007E5F0BE|nr:prominin-like protein [Drosophila miranda]
MFSNDNVASDGSGRRCVGRNRIEIGMALAEPPRERKFTGRGRKHHFVPLSVRGIHSVVLILVLLSLTMQNLAQDPDAETGTTGASGTESNNNADIVWREGYAGDGTTHEQLGQDHWPSVEYSPYLGSGNYSLDLTSSQKALSPVNTLTHFALRLFLSDLPPGYVTTTANNKLVLGPKVWKNDWAALLAQYWFLLVVVIFLLFCIIIIPFIGVCYCCFCCCLRCKQNKRSNEFRRRCLCSVCLALLVIGLMLGLFIMFIANKFLDRGLEDSNMTMKRASRDTCTFLKDVADHIYHLMVYNYQELDAHLDDQLNNAHDHIFLDLGDTSESTALAEMERILLNMPKALKIMLQVEALEKDIRFLGSLLRDGMRGQKRDLTYAAYALCHLPKCYKFNHDMGVISYDDSKCLHLDLIPNTTLFVEAMKQIIDDKLYLIPIRGMARLKKVKDIILKQMKLVLPPIFRSLTRSRIMLLDEAIKIRDLIDSMISDIHLNTLRTARTFDDVYEKFGEDRRTINIVIFLLIFIIIVILISALICGFLGPNRTMPGPPRVFSKGMAASCLFVAIIMIFCVFSFITLVGLFYLIIGLITYTSACAPLKNDQNIFRYLDPVIDINRYMSGSTEVRESFPTLPVSEAIRACNANESVFQLLRAKNIYDIDKLLNLEVFVDGFEDPPLFTGDLSNVELILEKEKLLLTDMRDGNLSEYHSILYSEHLCTKFIHTDIAILKKKTLLFSYDINTRYLKDWPGCLAYYLAAIDLFIYQDHILVPLTNAVNKLLEKVKEIDKLILYDNNNFGDSFKILMDAVERSENFIRNRGNEYINNLANNLSISVNLQIQEYIERVIREAENNVGHCKPLAYIYHQGASLICERLVDPINAFWLATLLCCMLLLPVLLVAHYLMCLYSKIYPSPIVAQLAAVEAARCPVCTGPPVMLAPANILSQDYRGKAGLTAPEELDRPLQVVPVRAASVAISKRKKD